MRGDRCWKGDVFGKRSCKDVVMSVTRFRGLPFFNPTVGSMSCSQFGYFFFWISFVEQYLRCPRFPEALGLFNQSVSYLVGILAG